LIADIDSYVAGTFKKPSPVTKINGQDAVTFLKNWAQLGALNDPDALYNTVFFSKPFAASTLGWQGYFAGSGRFGYIWPGPNTTLAFQNHSTASYHTTAGVKGNFTGVTDGESFYQQFCTGKQTITPPPSNTTTTTTTSSASSTPTYTKAAPVPGYPTPVVNSQDNVASGYYLDSSSTSDVAVLAMLSFEPTIPAEFQYVVQTFLADAKAAGKKKLVIDVSANGGGYILQGKFCKFLRLSH
jgi:hypothetical protein